MPPLDTVINPLAQAAATRPPGWRWLLPGARGTRSAIDHPLNKAMRLLGIACRPDLHWLLLRTLNGPHTRGIFQAYPRVAYRYTLPYLSKNLSRHQRHQMLNGHYHYLNVALRPEFFSRVLEGTLRLWEAELDGRRLVISVSGPCTVTKHREGDLCLLLSMDGAPLYRLAFSIVPTASLHLDRQAPWSASDHTLYIGQVQGVSGAFDLMRQAAHICHDVAPQDVLMACVAGVGAALGIRQLAGVDTRQSISYELFTRSPMTFDYNEFWAQYRAVISSGHHVIALPFHEKPLSDIAAKHRKRSANKRAFRHAVTAMAREVMAPLVISSPPG